MMPAYTEGRVTAKALYHRLEADRQPFLDRARSCSAITIPSLIPHADFSASNPLATPFQSVGARGVNNLASKLHLVLFPPTSPFFRLLVTEQLLSKLGAVEDPNAPNKVRTEVQNSLANIEREVHQEIEALGMRVPASEALLHLVVSGNALIYMDAKAGMRVFDLAHYVCERDPMGNVLTIVTKETIAFSALPSDLQLAINQARGMPEPKQAPYGPSSTVDLYTHVCLERKGLYRVRQEVEGMLVPGSHGTFTEESLPYMALRYKAISKENYGRGQVEEYLGDLISLETLSQAIVEGSAAAARVLFLVKPGASTRQKRLAQAPNGAIIEGDIEEVGVLRLEKQSDFNIAAQTADAIKTQLSFAFLLNTAIQRNGERVTAEEIRYMAGELEDALGSVYSNLSAEFQLPLVRRMLSILTKAERIPKLPKGIRPAIVTGVEALGRGHDLVRLRTAFAAAVEAVGPEQVAANINVPQAITRLFIASGVETSGLIKSEEQIAQEQAAAQQMAAAEKLGPELLKQIGSRLPSPQVQTT